MQEQFTSHQVQILQEEHTHIQTLLNQLYGEQEVVIIHLMEVNTMRRDTMVLVLVIVIIVKPWEWKIVLVL